MTTASTFSRYAARLRQFMARAVSEPPNPISIHSPAQETAFNALALELFALQREHNHVYRRLCASHGISPDTVARWSEVPAVPTSAFKEFDLTCLPSGERTAIFHSSGTTGQQPSRHFHSADSLALYEASLLPWFAAHLLCGRHPSGETRAGTETDFLALTPSPVDAPHSSLAHMFDAVGRAFGVAGVNFGGEVGADGAWSLDWPRVKAGLLAANRSDRPLVLLGTAFNFVHLIDAMTQEGFLCSLPAGSRALETGGYKGRSRTMPKAELHSLICRHLGVPHRSIICEYGMSELSSQAYDLAWNVDERQEADERVFRFPPWARVRVVSPETGREVADGEAGLIQVFDLANAWSVMAVQTQDLGVRRGDGFELLGRAAAAEPRGCSLMTA